MPPSRTGKATDVPPGLADATGAHGFGRVPPGQKPGVRKPRHLTRATAATMLVLAALAGCSDEADGKETDADGVLQTEAWQELDVCGLLDDTDVAALIGPGGTPEENTDPERGRPGCIWSVEGTNNSLSIRLWQPPIVEFLTDAERELAVGDHTGYVEGEGRNACRLHVEAEPAWLSLRVSVPYEKFHPRFCDVAAPTASKVLTQVD